LVDLTSENNYQFDSRKVHITDFGISYISRLANLSGGTTNVSGSREYLAPEILTFNNIMPTTMSDMWAVGVIGYEMCLGNGLTWVSEGFREIRAYLEGQQLNLWRVPQRYSLFVRQVIEACLAKNPTTRITAASLRDTLNRYLATLDRPQDFSFMGNNWQ
jgi:serine/threonine protein kinase